MKGAFLFLAILLNVLTAFLARWLDTAFILLALPIYLLTGFITSYASVTENPLLKSLGWGLFYGTLVSLLLSVVLFFWIISGWRS